MVVGATLTPDLRSVTFSQPFSGSVSSSSPSFLLGAMLEVGIAQGVLIEGDAIHQPITPIQDEPQTSRQHQHVGVFCCSANINFQLHGRKPFLEAGPVFRGAKALLGSSPYGVTAGVGIEKRLWRMAIAPSWCGIRIGAQTRTLSAALRHYKIK